MFYIRSARRIVDSKIDENRRKQKYELIQVMGILYKYIALTASNCSITLTVYLFQWKKIQCGIVLLFCIFETSVLSICGVNGAFFILCHTCISMGRIKEGDTVQDLS